MGPTHPHDRHTRDARVLSVRLARTGFLSSRRRLLLVPELPATPSVADSSWRPCQRCPAPPSVTAPPLAGSAAAGSAQRRRFVVPPMPARPNTAQRHSAASCWFQRCRLRPLPPTPRAAHASAVQNRPAPKGPSSRPDCEGSFLAPITAYLRPAPDMDDVAAELKHKQFSVTFLHSTRYKHN